MYTSQVTLAMLQDPELRVVYPTEGVGFGIMGTFIPSAAPNGDPQVSIPPDLLAYRLGVVDNGLYPGAVGNGVLVGRIEKLPLQHPSY